MIALGNDVVDLSWSPKNGQAYFIKLASFAFSECEYYHFANRISINDRIMMLWSIKEASYKSAVKLGLADRFNPKDFVIREIEMIKGLIYSKIQRADTILVGRTVMEHDKIHTITIHEDCEFSEVRFNDEWITSSDYSEQHVAVRDLVKKDGYCQDMDTISFSKNKEGIPFVLNNGELLKVDISFSHHGNLVGYGMKT
ncbi:MAG: 4'-phosphopantetheinyl transferase superfamily protein [Cytophagales bacterium]|nr:4'-phosphopantetheinyl transferase superfamily protein [Cytophagales bacterium]